MIERSEYLPLAEETTNYDLQIHPRSDDFDGHALAIFFVIARGQIDRAHAAFSELSDYAIRPDVATRSEWHACGGGWWRAFGKGFLNDGRFLLMRSDQSFDFGAEVAVFGAAFGEKACAVARLAIERSFKEFQSLLPTFGFHSGQSKPISEIAKRKISQSRFCCDDKPFD
jgi:hypothetical protein